MTVSGFLACSLSSNVFLVALRQFEDLTLFCSVCKFFGSAGALAPQTFDQSKLNIAWLYCAFLIGRDFIRWCSSASEKVTALQITIFQIILQN